MVNDKKALILKEHLHGCRGVRVSKDMGVWCIRGIDMEGFG